MANFEAPFASTGPRRSPTPDEKANGFPCGAADQTLFNGMFHRIEAELGNVISYAGLTPTDADYSQVRKAIVALIEAATGGGATENYLLLSQAITRFPIFPEVQSTDGRINLTAPATGTVRVPGGVNFLHRGINLVTTAQTDFNTTVSRTYHLRWNPTDGLSLKDLTDAGYNPTAASENSAIFDSTYDDMLLARVITNGANAATFTSLANKNALFFTNRVDGSDAQITAGGSGQRYFAATSVINWARVPKTRVVTGNIRSGALSPSGSMEGSAGYISLANVDRYSANATVETDWVEGATVNGKSAYMDFNFTA